MADISHTTDDGQRHSTSPRTIVRQSQASSPLHLRSEQSSPPASQGEEETMAATRSSNRPKGSASARGTGRVMSTRSSGRVEQPTQLSTVITPDEDQEMESEDDGTTRPERNISKRDVNMEDSAVVNKAEEGTPAVREGDVGEGEVEDEESDPVSQFDSPVKFPEGSDDLTPPPPSPTPSPPKPVFRPNLRIKVKFQGKTPIKARPATAKGKNKLPFRRGKGEWDGRKFPDGPLSHKRRVPPTATGAPSSTPALSATPGHSIEPTPAPEDEELSPVPADFEYLEEEDMSRSLSTRTEPTNMDVDEEPEEEEDEQEEQDELEEEQAEEEEEEEEEAEEEAAVDEVEEDEDEEEDEEEEMSVPPPGRMTARQAAMKGTGATVEFIELPTGPGKKKNLTPQEMELRKQEQSRKRSLQSAQKLEDEKQATIRRLLSKQAPKTRSSRSGVSSTTAPGSSGDGSVTPQLAPAPTLSRWVSSKDGVRWAVPPEAKWLAYMGPVKRVGPGRMQEIKGETEEDVDMDGPADLGEAHVELVPPPRARPQAICAIDGCGQARKYRSVKDFGRGACGLEHLRVLNTLIV
ncbi:hypothetical protein DACRYDRAFT_23787 [Dacryopinax primogenitus]|uniref:INO80 complex subunit B-like conserved region domain-containing protein n=1 Tax=Dacryopinax primogenitus (strain DJM 731) TaxID=1858805 RepID=M5G5Y3_DACPD|nr:uncharacterized protein DACRYDRAFT_23787 [Dacryopinax primogenitus]EJT99167.1 hypothetical protein DACRYDRAFT_23787 [Dacryopinax primogenitus]